MRSPTNDICANRLRQLREKCGLKQWEIAEAIDCDRSTYSYYETGKTQPDMNTLCRLASVFRVTVNDVLGEIGTRGAEGSSAKTVEEIVHEFETLTDEERHLLLRYRTMNENDRTKMKMMCRTSKERMEK